MTADGSAPVDSLGSVQDIYATRTDDLEFSVLLSLHPGAIDDDDHLAELIEADGRVRLDGGRKVSLERYLAALPDLVSREVALDAAIDVTLRSMSGASRSSVAAVDELIREHPALERAIRDAAALGNQIWSTNALRERMTVADDRELPCDFGPPLADGRARFELRERLGAGAAGQVFRAVDRHLSEDDHDAVVAIKVIPPQADVQTDDEAVKARRIDHPNVVRVLDRGQTSKDERFIVYEFVAGGTLSGWIENFNGRVPPQDAVRMMAAVARGVQATHTAGLIHCDLKPGNIMITTDGEPKLADFGIAMRDTEREARGSGSGAPIGNLAFISPEQYHMDRDAMSGASDVYALGGMLYLMLTGKLPNGSTADEIERTHDPVKGRQAAPSPRAVSPMVDRDLDMICRKAMAIDRRERYSAAASLAEDLEHWRASRPIHWTNPSPGRVFSLWLRRRPGTAAAIAVIALLVIGGGFAAVRAKVNADRIANAKEIGGGVAAKLMQFNQERKPATRLFHVAWVLNYAFSPPAMPEPVDLHGTHVAALRNLEKFIAQATADDRPSEYFTCGFRLILALWLLAEGEHERAVDHLDQLDLAFADMLDEGDAAREMVEALRAAHSIQVILDRPPTSPLTDDERAELQQARDRLAQEEAYLARTDLGSPFHAFLLDMLVRVHEADALADPSAVKHWTREHAASQRIHPFLAEPIDVDDS